MAVDSLRKRASLIGYGLPFRLMLPPADGSVDQGDRQHLVGLYTGILAGAAVAVAAVICVVDERFTIPDFTDESFTIPDFTNESFLN